ncbi:sulfurtransferase [Salinicola acroporae]|uniref:Sulfurtransferase n=1 Tax=Salinicola acroporae TaxID=1541440 RepID=A0ABT6I4W0_9GAMM|nr:sulfurtransferase [Salinicola acroporae]MDH4572577.1 thiosulfate sulfurtransferase [Salinicola acroporae]
MSSETPQLPLILDPATLSRHLEDPHLLIIDVPLKVDSYPAGHVPGAIFLDSRRLLAGYGEVPNDVPTEAALSTLFSELGLTPETHVVAYDDEGGGWAGRLLWTLELIGHRRYSYLNGGIHAWRADGHPLETISNTPTPSDYQAAYLNPALQIRREELIERLDDPQLAIWDARSAEEYRGTKGDNRKLGHIPGAVNFDWLDVMDKHNDLRLRDYAELITELEARGLTPDKEIVTHCQSHHRSGLTWLAAKALGYDNVRAYPGSWKEWGNRDDTPVEK